MRIELKTKEPIFLYCFFQYRPIPLVIPHSYKIRRNDFVTPLRAKALKKYYLRVLIVVVVVSLLASSSILGVLKRVERVVGAKL